jgi:pyruvate kinase
MISEKIQKDDTEMIVEMQNKFLDSDKCSELRIELELIQKRMLDLIQSHNDMLQGLDKSQRLSCSNLLSYLVLRSEDIRDLQNRLHLLGLSSLASSESHIYSQMNAILERLGKIIPELEKTSFGYDAAVNDIRRKGGLLFGVKKEATVPFIMVTLDSNFAGEVDPMKELLVAGMNVARINCAHDDKPVWSAIINNIRQATDDTGLPCKIYMDLAGPKIRTVLRGKKGKKKEIKVSEGDRILLADMHDSKHAEYEVVGCTINGIICQLKKGERVLFDDGTIESVVENADDEGALLRIVRVSRQKPFIKPEKGINFPDSRLSLSSITDFDMECLPFICQHADLIGYSFVRNINDLAYLQNLIKEQVKREILVILKIETQEAVMNLPSLLIQGMRDKAFGVMIARGDLAIEVGFERMSEVQEEILWICEAAHVPVIWATQVLETLNKSGLASRSEITDAAFSGLSECVMINKGEHTLAVIKTLKDILFRGGGHHIKKRYTFRPLSIAKNYLNSLGLNA